ncbi:restriction endonuclease subunit S [Hymenobacter glaciei]
MKNITQGNMRNFPIPLPPLAEQHRIVAKLAQLLGHCDALEQRIAESRRLAGQLLQTALHEALAGPGGVVAATEAALVVPRQGRKKELAAEGTGDLFAAG